GASNLSAISYQLSAISYQPSAKSFPSRCHTNHHKSLQIPNPESQITSDLLSTATKEPAMKLSRISMTVFAAGTALLLTPRLHSQKAAPNIVTGEGLPNPAP